MALILGGVALASGAVRLPRREAATVAVVSVSIRPAADADVDFLVELYADEDVRPFLAAAGSYDRDGVVATRSRRTRSAAA